MPGGGTGPSQPLATAAFAEPPDTCGSARQLLLLSRLIPVVALNDPFFLSPILSLLKFVLFFFPLSFPFLPMVAPVVAPGLRRYRVLRCALHLLRMMPVSRLCLCSSACLPRLLQPAWPLRKLPAPLLPHAGAQRHPVCAEVKARCPTRLCREERVADGAPRPLVLHWPCLIAPVFNTSPSHRALSKKLNNARISERCATAVGMQRNHTNPKCKTCTSTVSSASLSQQKCPRVKP